MSVPSRWRRLFQLRLRTLLAALTLLLIVGNGFLIWWRTPFVVERRTTNPGEEVLAAWRTATQSKGPPRRLSGSGFGGGMLRVNFRERWQVYCNLRGERIRHGPYEVLDDQGRRVHAEHWVHGALEGPSIYLTPAGERVYWGEYLHGDKHGVWRRVSPGDSIPHGFEVYERGVLRLLERYVKGKLSLRERFGPRGELVEQTQFTYATDATTVDASRYALDADGVDRLVMWGRCRRGERASVLGPMVDNLEHGAWEFRDGSDALVKQAEFRSGRLLLRDGEPAPPIVPDPTPRDSAVMRTIRSSLESPITLRFDHVPLDEAFSFIAELHEIPLRLNAAACRRAGVSPEQEITLDLRSGCTLRAALQIVAAEVGLIVAFRDDALVAFPAVDAASE